MTPTDGQPISMSDFNISSNDFFIGSVFEYKGDNVPFESQFLNSKHAASGVYLLPKISHEDANGGRKYAGIPVHENTLFVIKDIEQNRKGKKTKKHPEGRPLEDLVILTCDEFPNSKWGMNYADIIAKFSLSNLSTAQSDKVMQEYNESSNSWINEVQETGW